MRRALMGCGFVDPSSSMSSWTETPWHIVQESDAIIAAWGAGGHAQTNGVDNLETYALVETAYEAAKSGRSFAPTRS